MFAVNASAQYEAIKDFKHVFETLGCLKRPYSMVLKPDAVPVVQPARRIPLSLRQPLREELRRMEWAGIIKKEDGPTDWVSPLVLVWKKDSKLRVCMDPSRINEHVKRQHYQLPKREDMELELASANYFGCLELRCKFWLPPDTARRADIENMHIRHSLWQIPFPSTSIWHLIGSGNYQKNAKYLMVYKECTCISIFWCGEEPANSMISDS